MSLTADEPSIQAAILEKIEKFARSLVGEVKQQVTSAKELKIEKEAIEKARKLADLREVEERKQPVEQISKFNTAAPKVEDDDLDLEDFIDSNPWGSGNKPTIKTPIIDELISEPEKTPAIVEESTKIEEPELHQGPKLKINQKKLKPKAK